MPCCQVAEVLGSKVKTTVISGKELEEVSVMYIVQKHCMHKKRKKIVVFFALDFGL